MASCRFHLLPNEPEPDPRARTRTVTISGQKVEAITNLADFGDEVEQPYHNIWRKGSKKKPDCTWALEIETPTGAQFHRMWERDKRKRSVIWRDLGAVVVENATGCGFAEIVALRRWPFLLLPVLAALLVLVCLSFCSVPGSDGTESPAFLAGQQQAEDAASQPIASVEYATYYSTSDTVLAADSLQQDSLTLSLPAVCANGGGNPVASAPSVFIDLNADGEFSSDELVYNPGGELLRPGCEVSAVEFTRAVPAGEYLALTCWDSVLSEDHSEYAGSASFKWRATFE